RQQHPHLGAAPLLRGELERLRDRCGERLRQDLLRMLVLPAFPAVFLPSPTVPFAFAAVLRGPLPAVPLGTRLLGVFGSRLRREHTPLPRRRAPSLRRLRAPVRRLHGWPGAFVVVGGSSARPSDGRPDGVGGDG